MEAAHFPIISVFFGPMLSYGDGPTQIRSFELDRSRVPIPDTSPTPLRKRIVSLSELGNGSLKLAPKRCLRRDCKSSQ